jgi:hypothetical protein
MQKLATTLCVAITLMALNPAMAESNEGASNQGEIGKGETSMAELLAARMLERLGGRDAWANLKNTVNGSIQNRNEEPTEVYSVITLEFDQPRFRIDTTSESVNLVRVINGDKSWRISWAGVVEDLPGERFEDDLNWYQAHIYRTIHRIAAEDPALELRLEGADRLEVYEQGERLVWIRLDAKAEPFAFGFRQDESGSLSGPWTIEKSGVRHPSWISSADGTWRAAIKSLEFNVPLHESQFSRPVDPGSDNQRPT